MTLTAEQWIAHFAEALGLSMPEAGEIEAMLELASVAAHASERRAAPVACWLAATAGMSPERARDIAEALNLPPASPPAQAPPGR